MTAMIDTIAELADELLQYNSFLILTHAYCDGDTLGSGCALALALKQKGKKATVINNDVIPQKYHYMTDLVPYEDFEPECIVSVDVADTKLLGSDIEAKYADKVDISVDHHGTNKLFAKKLYLEAESASCCEIICLLLEQMGTTFTKDIANCIFTGVSTDTGCFKYSNVTSRTHEIGAKMISYGAQSGKINEIMFDTKTFAQLKLQKVCLDNLELFFDGKVAVFSITNEISEETGCPESDFDFIVTLSRQIEGVKFGITLKQKPDNSFKASVRTNDNYDAAEFCALFGGGGHAKAAGASFFCSLEEAKAQLLEKLEEILK